MLAMLEENEAEWCEALMADLRKPRQEAILMEVQYTCNHIKTAL